MKKLFILFLCLMAVAGFVSAGTVHPPGASVLEALPGYAVDYCAVTPDTVLVIEIAHGLPDQILVVPDLIVTGLPQIVFRASIDDPLLPDIVVENIEYPLRL
jgi:hypothetical protein